MESLLYIFTFPICCVSKLFCLCCAQVFPQAKCDAVTCIGPHQCIRSCLSSCVKELDHTLALLPELNFIRHCGSDDMFCPDIPELQYFSQLIAAVVWNFVHCCTQAFIVLRIWFFWDVTLHHNARGWQHIQGPRCLHLKVSSTWLLKVRTLQSLRLSANYCVMTYRHILLELESSTELPFFDSVIFSCCELLIYTGTVFCKVGTGICLSGNKVAVLWHGLCTVI